MHKSFIFLFSLIILLTNLYACDDKEFKWQEIDKQAVADAEALGSDVHYSYLQCYPLDQQSKTECVQQLNDQYIKTEYKADIRYQKSFQYKAEKLGFLKFLGIHNLPCFGIDHGPQFIKSMNSYQVECNCGNNYLAQFDYGKREWYLMK